MDPNISESTTRDPLVKSGSEYDSDAGQNDRVTSAALLGEPRIDTDANETIIGGTITGEDQMGIYDSRERDLDSEDASHEEPAAGIVSGSPYESVSEGTSAFEADLPVSMASVHGYETNASYATETPLLTETPATPEIVTTGADSQPGDGIKQTLGQTGDQVKQTAGQIGDQVKQTAGQVVEQAKTQATDFVTTAKQQLNDQLTAQKDQAAKRLDDYTETLRQTGQSFQDKGEGAVGTIVTSLAEQIDGASGYLKSRDVGQITQETESFARQQPGLFLGLAFVAGVAVARFLKSTQSPAH